MSWEYAVSDTINKKTIDFGSVPTERTMLEIAKLYGCTINCEQKEHADVCYKNENDTKRFYASNIWYA